MEKVIVTGVGGFVGPHLVNELNSQGFAVIGVGREKEPPAHISNSLDSYYTCDLADYEQTKELPIATAKAVINLAGLAAVGPSFDQPELYMRVNTVVLDTICKAAAEQHTDNLCILSISSGAVYSSQQPMPLSEESVLNPDSSPYAASKIAMEELAKKYTEKGLDVIVARPFNHIGPGQGLGFILPDLYKKITDAKASQQPLLVGNLTTRRDYTDVRDVARAYVSLISKKTLNHSIYNVCSGRSLSGEDILHMLLAELSAEDLNPQVDQSLFRPSDAQDLFGDNTKLRQDTGWQPDIDIQQTVRDFVASMQATS